MAPDAVEFSICFRLEFKTTSQKVTQHPVSSRKLFKYQRKVGNNEFINSHLTRILNINFYFAFRIWNMNWNTCSMFEIEKK